MRAFAHKDYQTLIAMDIMREGVVQIPPDIPLDVAAQLMLDHGVGSMFLIHHADGVEYPAAVISNWHIIRHMAVNDLNDL